MDQNAIKKWVTRLSRKRTGSLPRQGMKCDESLFRRKQNPHIKSGCREGEKQTTTENHRDSSRSKFYDGLFPFYSLFKQRPSEKSVKKATPQKELRP